MPFWSLSISPTPKKPKICWIFSLQTTSTQVFFHLKIWRGGLKSTGDALDGSEIRWLHQLSLVVYPAIYWAFYIPRGFLSSTGYLCFLCGISSKSRMTVAHRMTGYHDATNGKPMVTWKVSPRFFFFLKNTSPQMSGTSSETLKSLTLPNQNLHLRDSYEKIAKCK